MHIGVIGAGAAAAAATYVLDQTVSDAEITILEKSGGVCGRAATRRREGITYDYGANYVKDEDPRVSELLTEELDTDGLVEITEPIYVFDENGTVSEGRDSATTNWNYREGLTQIAKRLFAETDATVHRRTRVELIERREDAWVLTDTEGTTWGPFDALLCNPPAPQTAALLRDAAWDAPLVSELIGAIDAVPYRTIYTAVLGYAFDLDVPYYALVNPGKDHEVGWIAREECKPGHVPADQSVLVVQANHEWSVEHYDESPADNVERLADLTADVIGDERLASPDWTDQQGWRYALPDDAVRQGPLDSAAEDGLYFLGDWVTGEARVHAALRNGLDTGERVAHSL
jgi:renalase